MRKRSAELEEEDVQVVVELPLDGREVHGPLDDFPVSEDDFVVDWCEKRPGIFVSLQLS